MDGGGVLSNHLETEVLFCVFARCGFLGVVFAARWNSVFISVLAETLCSCRSVRSFHASFLLCLGRDGIHTRSGVQRLPAGTVCVMLVCPSVPGEW